MGNLEATWVVFISESTIEVAAVLKPFHHEDNQRRPGSIPLPLRNLTRAAEDRKASAMEEINFLAPNEPVALPPMKRVDDRQAKPQRDYLKHAEDTCAGCVRA